MNFKKLTNVIYITPKDDQVYTVIKEVNEIEALYTLDFNDELVPENKVKLNTHSVFSVPSSMRDGHIADYHYHQLVNHVLYYLKSNNPYPDIKVSRESDIICFETTIELPEILEEKKYFHEEMDKLNALIGQVNSQIKSRFNKHIEVILKLPLHTHYLHAIRI